MPTLDQYLTQTCPHDGMVQTIQTVAQTGKAIANLLRGGALNDVLGAAGQQNVQGETQQKLDVLANDLLLSALTRVPACAGVASEEMTHPVPANDKGDLLVLFDPLDGSSNIDINMTVGTIFSVLPHPHTGTKVREQDFLQAGSQQLAAGYVLYGPATMLALCFEQHNQHGVALFALDPKQDTFVQVDTQLRIDSSTSEYAINASNYRHWLAPMQQYVNELLAGTNGPRGKNYNTRWVAAMVADVHRILCRGGVFIYPFDQKDPSKAGKLRLLYEAAPMSLLVEHAGGQATDAQNRLLDIVPSTLHQRVAVVLGSAHEVQRVQQLHTAADQ